MFPLLEDEEEVEEDSVLLIHQRLQWLTWASKASQEEFVLQWRHKEPAKSAHRTWAAVLGTKNRDMTARWLEMEKLVCTRKLCAMWANIKNIGKLYDIDMRMSHRGDDGDSRWKFPHQAEARLYLGPHKDTPAALAQDGFPLTHEPRRAATESETCVVEDFFRQQ